MHVRTHVQADQQPVGLSGRWHANYLVCMPATAQSTCCLGHAHGRYPIHRQRVYYHYLQGELLAALRRQQLSTYAMVIDAGL